MTPGLPLPEDREESRVRSALIGLGFSELLSFMLVDPAQYERLRLGPPDDLVRIQNPKTQGQGAFRMTLLGGIVDTLARNAERPTPQRVFEVGRVALVDDAAETGAREERRVAFAIAGPSTGYADGRSVLDGLAAEMGWGNLRYAAASHPTFLEGRTARASAADGQAVAWLGDVHPEVLLQHRILHPVVAAEITLRGPGNSR